MKEMFFLGFLLILLGAPSFILCDLHPPEEKEQICLVSNSIEAIQDMQPLGSIKEVSINSNLLESKATNIAKGVNTPAYRNLIQKAKEKVHEREERALQRVLDKTIDNWNLSFGLSHIQSL